MKASFIEQHGGPDVIKFGDQPEPVTGAGQVKLRVRSAGVNRLDLYTRAGIRGQQKTFPPAHILGGDCSGEIVEVGEHVGHELLGKRVLVNPLIDNWHHNNVLSNTLPRFQFIGSDLQGSYAEYLVVNQENVHHIGNEISFEEAASIPTVFLPIWNMLYHKAKLKPWETVLILSGSSGVGTAAIQVAKNIIGATVIATTSAIFKSAKARDLGADYVINYSQDDILGEVKNFTQGKGVDVVVDHVAGKFFKPALQSLKPHGRYGNCGVTDGYQVSLQMGLIFTKQISIHGIFMGTNTDMHQIVTLLNRGKLKAIIEKNFPLKNAGAAHERLDKRKVFGKIVLTI